MSEGLPSHVRVGRLAARGASLESVTPVAAMERLCGLLMDDSGMVHSGLVFSLDEYRRMVVSGKAQASVVVECQRCLAPMTLDLECVIELVVVEQDSHDDDTVVAERGEIPLLHLIEDELILAMPIVAMHDGEGRCGIELKS